MKKKLRLVGLFIALNIILLTICSSIQAASSVTVRFSHVTTADYNIHGSYSGSDIQTTYSDSGYRTKFRVNGGAEYEVTNGTGSGSNVVCTTTGTPISNGAYIKVNYKLKNNSSSEVTVDLASDADIQIGSNDDAPITKISGNRGFTMSDGKNHMFTFLCRDSYGVSPNVTAFWFGQYGNREKHRWDKSDVSINSLTDGTDSGMIFSWQNQKIPANGEINLSVLFGIGELNEPPTLTVESSFEDHYFVNEEVDIFGRVGDKDTSDTVKIIYAVDDGDEIELAEEYSPNGGEVDYDTKFTIPAGTTPGDHKIQIWARDDNGNMSVPVELHFTVSADNDPPVGSHTLEPDTWTRGDVTIHLTATDALSGMKRIKLPDGTYYNGLSARERARLRIRTDGNSMSTDYLATANNTYTFELEDKAGNKVNYPVVVNNIDRDAPTISVTGNPDTPTTNNITITIVTDDTQSGVKEVYIDGEKLDNTDSNEYTFYKNGTHTIRVVDNVGNENTQEVVIVNKYCECTAGLDHPNYSSDLDGCPICALIEGMEITNETNVYDAQDHRVEYTNPHRAEIVEYYDGGKTLPNDVNTYNYELKVKYNGNEYKTGLTGEYIVTKKIITITGVDATDREYNKSNVVDLTGGELVGVESGDEVNFVLSKTGTSDSEKVGTHNVTIPEITLTGKDASNYTLTQPEHTDVDVVISPKHITITGIDATDREYNKSNVVDLTGGELVGVESGDEVNFVLSKTGTSDSEKVGTHNVTIPEITLTGKDASNYTLTQPEHTDVDVVISPKHITITGIDATDREYNKSNVVDLTGGELVGVESGDEVNFVLPQTGTSGSEKVGTHNVTVPEITLTGADASNYTLTQPEHTDVDVVISPKHITITGIDATDREYNKSNVVNLTGGELVGVESGDEVNFVLPQTGTSDSEKVGTHNVTVPEITLTGADASNYTLTQPEHTDVDVVISPKHITIEDIVIENREYDKTNIVNVSGGKLVGIEPEDDVTFALPSTGTIDDVIVGKYNVNLNEITLEGLDASNYILVQPEKETLNVEITRRKVKVEDLHAESKKYDKNKVVKLEGTTLDRKIDGDDVYAIIPENGISENEDVGNWKVNIDEIVLKGADAFNYEIVQPEYGEVMVEIIKPDAPEMNINSYVIEINGEKIENKEEITELPQVRLGDIVKIKIDITNNGIGAGYIENVKVKVPQGLEFIKEDEINIENEWTEEDNDEMLYQTSIYSFDKGVENELKTSQSKSLEIVFKVTQEEMIEENLMVCTEVEQTDIRKENRPYNEEYISNKSDVEIYMAYTDFVANLSVKEVINELTGEEVPLEVAKNLAKFDVPEEELQNEKYKIVYQVNIQNTGKTEGTVDSVVSYLPENVEFLQDENSDWKVISNTNKIVTNETFKIDPEKEEIKEIVVHWSVNNNLESKVNEIMLLSSDDIDQRKIVDIPYEKVEEGQIDKEAINKTNNISKVTMFASILEMVNTGDIAVYALIGIALVSAAGIVYISKKKISLSK